MRGAWTSLTDEQLLAQCAVDTYRASGPGGQKRNKTSSAVRIRHLPSQLLVIAEESRSQHENRARALKRLRQALWLRLREPPAPEALAARHGPLDLGRKDPRFWPTIGLVLDVLLACEGRAAEAAGILGTSTANLVDFLRLEPRAWQEANALRQRFGLKLLR